MRTFEENKRIYAELILKFWLNIQKGQNLIIKAPIEVYDFVKILTEIAYKLWVKHILYRWWSDELDCIRYENAPEDSFDEYPQRIADWYTEEVKKWAATLSLYMTDSKLFEKINANRVKRLEKVSEKAFQEYRAFVSSGWTNRIVAAVPIKWRANTVYWSENTEDNVEKLWKQIFNLVRIDQEDPIKAREKHVDNLKSHADYLNEKKFKKLHYKSPKTDLVIELPEGHIWTGAWEKNKRGVFFHPNLPTEEVFSMPHKYKVNWKVSATLPLQYWWKLIKNFTLTFKDWKVVDFTAEEWYEILKSIIETDENSCRLWEVAIVPIHSPIYQSWLIYYNTLFDENASCHLALWTSFPINLKWSDNLSKEEKDAAGMNISMMHVDFMVWDETLCITWETYEWEMIDFFVNWDWNI